MEKVLTANKFRIESQKRPIVFYFSMKLVIDSLTDAYANQWTSNELLTDFAFKVKWLKQAFNKTALQNDGFLKGCFIEMTNMLSVKATLEEIA